MHYGRNEADIFQLGFKNEYRTLESLNFRHKKPRNMQLLTFESNKRTQRFILRIITEFPDAAFDSKNQNKCLK